MRGRRRTLRALVRICRCQVIFSFWKSVFRDVRTVKANFNGGFVVRTHKYFSWGHKRSLFFVGIQDVSARRVRKELINHSLYFFA